MVWSCARKKAWTGSEEGEDCHCEAGKYDGAVRCAIASRCSQEALRGLGRPQCYRG